MFHERVEGPVVMEEDMTFFDAPRGDQRVDRLAHGHPTGTP
jgi:hypothetical protein